MINPLASTSMNVVYLRYVLFCTYSLSVTVAKHRAQNEQTTERQIEISFRRLFVFEHFCKAH